MRTLDTRDLYKRQNELESLRDTYNEALAAFENFDSSAPIEDGMDKGELERMWMQADSDFGPDEREELAEIEEIAGYAADFRHGETMVPVDDFEEYAQELASDTCDMKEASGWPFRHIDWKEAAEELAQDYTEVTYLGTAYYVRS